MTIQAVLFDLGHTVWNYAPRPETLRFNVLRLHGRLQSALGDGVPGPAAIDRALGEAASRWIKQYYEAETFDQPPSAQAIGELVAALPLDCAPELVEELTEVFFGSELDVPVVAPDTLAALATLHCRGLALGCVTNTMTLDGGIRDVLYRLGLTRYFDSVVVSSEGGYRKPHPSLFERALRELEVAPTEAIFVGDRLLEDVQGAKAAGMRAVLTHQYRQEPIDGVQPAPDAVVRRLSELPAVIDRLDALSWD